MLEHPCLPPGSQKLSVVPGLGCAGMDLDYPGRPGARSEMHFFIDMVLSSSWYAQKELRSSNWEDPCSKSTNKTNIISLFHESALFIKKRVQGCSREHFCSEKEPLSLPKVGPWPGPTFVNASGQSPLSPKTIVAAFYMPLGPKKAPKLLKMQTKTKITIKNTTFHLKGSVEWAKPRRYEYY